jgi:hypothetical protein
MSKKEKTTLYWSALWFGVSFLFATYGKLIQMQTDNIFVLFLKMLIISLPFFVCGWYIGRFLQYKTTIKTKIFQSIVFLALVLVSLLWFSILNIGR